MSERLTKRFVGGYGLVKVRDDEQDVTSPYKNTLQSILECFERLGKIEDVLYDADGNELIGLDRLRELAEAERENRLTVYKYPNCYHCPRLPKTNIWQDDEPCKSCRSRALAATEPKGDAT